MSQVPYVQGPTPPPQPYAPPAAPKRASKAPWIITGAAVLVALTLGGAVVAMNIDDSRPGGNTPSGAATSDARPVANLVECANVEKAYNAWDGPMSVKAATDAAELTELTVDMLARDGDAFAVAVNGYTDKPALNLSVAIAEYNVELGLINLSLTVAGKIVDAEQPAKVAAAAGRVRESYAAFQAATCS